MRQMNDEAWRRHLARKDLELAEAKAKYQASEEYSRLPTMTTAELVALYVNAHEWLRHPCGDSDIDGGILERSQAVGAILVARGAPFYDGIFHEPEKSAGPAKEA